MYFMQLMGLLHFSSKKTLFSRQTIVFKSKAAYSSSVLSNCSFITTLWIQISLSTCFTALTWARIFSPKSARTQISFSDVEGENERKGGCRDLVPETLNPFPWEENPRWNWEDTWIFCPCLLWCLKEEEHAQLHNVFSDLSASWKEKFLRRHHYSVDDPSQLRRN